MLTRETFLSKRAIVTKSVEIDGLGAVRVRELTVAEAKSLSNEFKEKNADAAIFIAQRCLVDEAGSNLLTAEEAPEALNALGIGTLNNIVKAVLEHSGMQTKEAIDPKS